MDSKYSFLDQEPPPGYVAGIGRGATGFTTQPDFGGGRLANFDNRGIEADEEIEIDVEKFDDADDGLLTTKNRDGEDDEADAIYDEIERKLKSRRKKRKIDDIDNDDDADDESRQTNKISEQFRDLKKELVTVTEDEWLHLPEVRDLTKKNKRQRETLQAQQRYYALPDNILNGMNQNLNSDVTNFKSISSAKDKLLEMELDKLAPIDTNEDKTSLTTTQADDNDNDQTAFDIDNIANTKQARLILANLRKNEPHNASGWISGARLEESVKRLNAARNLIAEGCNLNPLNEAIWLENMRLNSKEAKSIIRQALMFQPKSVKLWLSAFELETELMNRKRLLRKALENIPTSVELWKAAIDLESGSDQDEDRKKLLIKAVELTNSLELWLQLIDSETDISQAKKYLNDARKLNPNSIDIWIYAARLEEKVSENEIKIEKLLVKGIKQIPLARDEYIKKAIELENDGFAISCSVILRNVLDLNMENIDSDEQKIKIWLKDAKFAAERGFIESAKTIYQFILMKFPNNVQTWRLFLKFIKANKPLQELFVFFQEAIDSNPTVELFWLWYAKEYMLQGEFDRARRILNDAMEVLPNNEEILFAIIKLEKAATAATTTASSSSVVKDLTRLYQRGINEIGSVRFFYKYITYLRTINEDDEALKILDQALSRFPNCFKLYLQKAQIHESHNEIAKAIDILQHGVLELPHCTTIWLYLSTLENSMLKKNAILDKAIAQNPKDGLLWRAKYRLSKQQTPKSAHMVLSKALKLIPTSPELWCEQLLNLERKSLQKTSFRDAMTQTNDHPLVLNTIGYLLWKDGKISRCKNFFDKSIELNPDLGDSWILLYLFLTRHGDPDEVETLLKDVEKADPHHGEMWCSISKRIDMIDCTKEQILQKGVEYFNNL